MDRVLVVLLVIISATGLGACQRPCAEISGVADFIRADQEATVTIWDCDGLLVVDQQPMMGGEPYTIELSSAGCYNGVVSMYDPSDDCTSDWVMDDSNLECGDSLDVEWKRLDGSCPD